MLASALKLRLVDRGRNWRLKSQLLEITGGLGLSVDLINSDYDDGEWCLHLHLGWPNIFIRLPFLARRQPRDDMADSWGFSVDRDSFAAVHLHWGARTKIVHFPWAWTFYRRSVLALDGRTWISELASHRLRADDPNAGFPATQPFFTSRDWPRWEKKLPYRYVLCSGEIQEREATISVQEFESRWRWFSWLPFPRKISRSIDVQFSAEVGEQSGSWKGGCTGCGYTLLPSETPDECLRRMERDRKF